MYTHYSNLNSC